MNVKNKLLGIAKCILNAIFMLAAMLFTCSVCGISAYVLILKYGAWYTFLFILGGAVVVAVLIVVISLFLCGVLYFWEHFSGGKELEEHVTRKEETVSFKS